MSKVRIQTIRGFLVQTLGSSISEGKPRIVLSTTRTSTTGSLSILRSTAPFVCCACADITKLCIDCVKVKIEGLHEKIRGHTF